MQVHLILDCLTLFAWEAVGFPFELIHAWTNPSRVRSLVKWSATGEFEHQIVIWGPSSPMFLDPRKEVVNPDIWIPIKNHGRSVIDSAARRSAAVRRR